MLRQAFTDEHLCHAWDRVRSRNAAPGADGVTVSGFGLNLERNLRRLRREILAGRYRPCPTLRCHIPKADGDFRRIGIPAGRASPCRSSAWIAWWPSGRSISPNRP